MFTHETPTPSRKRERDEDDDQSCIPGFSQHRIKRRVSSLVIRHSPDLKRRRLPTIIADDMPPRSPSLADITPAVSDSEDAPKVEEPKSFFSPWSSSPEFSMLPSSEVSPCPSSAQSGQMHDAPVYSDDLEMTDSSFLSPGPFQPEPLTSLSSRIPTPIYCQFSSYIRSADKAPSHFNYSMNTSSGTHTNDDAVDHMRRNRRLPSPISEDETSPSLILEGLSDMQMEVEVAMVEVEVEEPKVTPKKGHSRSSHSARPWGGFGLQMGVQGGGKRFSMGFKSDCEKCRMKVPGHFSHIVNS